MSHLRSLGFGGLLGGGLAGLLFVLGPELFPVEITLNQLILIGSMLGAALHRVVDRLFGVLSKPARYYLSIGELYLQGAWVDDELKREILRALTERYFLEPPHREE